MERTRPKTFLDLCDDVLAELHAPLTVDPDVRWCVTEIVGVRGDLERYSWTDAPENAYRARLREAALMSIARRLIEHPLFT